jgi:NADH-quinone oxidoreductase subunit G
MVTIQVDGQELQAKPGSMLIEVTDEAGINIPRFCYHEKLSIAANCRMCLVEVENAPKPLPACATPVTNGMKVHTRSPKALAAQQGTMEFLLINHPLDCPICDQGGECELQDVAMGYGRDVSRYVERKRVVADKDIGPLIATDMTRCIHCTRCVRFGEEIAGIRELGATGRGEHMVIGTFVEKSVDSELSGNIIDLCPVGALTSKPFRYQARAWEMIQLEAVAPHDSVGSNLHLHVRDNRVMRVHPKDNEAINECWLSDRDRFSYQGLYSEDRLIRPLVKKQGEWQEASWEQALEMAAEGLQQIDDAAQIGMLCAPSSTLEELYLAQKLMRGLGGNNIDTRLRQADFRLDASAKGQPWLGLQIEQLEDLQAILLIGANLRKEQPILAHRLRKAALNGAAVGYISPYALELNYPATQQVGTPWQMVQALASVAKALGVKAKGDLAGLIDQAQVDDFAEGIAQSLKQAETGAVLLGNLAMSHPDYAVLSGLAQLVAAASDAQLGFIPEAANSVGAGLAGALPHLASGARLVEQVGLDSRQMLQQPRAAYLLLGVDPAADFWDPVLARQALQSAEKVIALSCYRTEALEACADILLPIAGFAETAGTYVNAAGTWQSFRAAVRPLGEARPAWKILRVLGNLLGQSGFDYTACEQIQDELKSICAGITLNNDLALSETLEFNSRCDGLMRIGDVPLYAQDALVRHAAALQQTHEARPAAIRVNLAEARRQGLEGADSARAQQNGSQVNLPLELDERVPDGCVWISAALAGTEMLGGQFGEVTLEKA